MTFFFILIIYLVDIALIFLGEILSWSLMGVKGILIIVDYVIWHHWSQKASCNVIWGNSHICSKMAKLSQNTMELPTLNGNFLSSKSSCVEKDLWNLKLQDGLWLLSLCFDYSTWEAQSRKIWRLSVWYSCDNFWKYVAAHQQYASGADIRSSY